MAGRESRRGVAEAADGWLLFCLLCDDAGESSGGYELWMGGCCASGCMSGAGGCRRLRGERRPTPQKNGEVCEEWSLTQLEFIASPPTPRL